MRAASTVSGPVLLHSVPHGSAPAALMLGGVRRFANPRLRSIRCNKPVQTNFGLPISPRADDRALVVYSERKGIVFGVRNIEFGIHAIVQKRSVDALSNAAIEVHDDVSAVIDRASSAIQCA